MDIKRILLFAALAVVSYMIIMQWNEDYQPRDIPVTAPAVVQLDNPAADTSTDDALQLAAPPQTGNDLSVNTEMPAAGQATLVRVVTDTLDVRINPRGGDLVYAALLQHKTRVDSDNPFVLLQDDAQRHYVVQSDVLGLGSSQRIQLQPQAYDYQLQADQDELRVVMQGEVNGVKVNKIFTFTRGSHAIHVSYQLHNTSEQTYQPSLIGLIKRDGSDDPSKGEFMGLSAYLGGAFSTESSRYQKISFGDMEGKGFQEFSSTGWAAMLQHYFISAWIPTQNQQNFFSTRVDSHGRYLVGFKGEDTQLAPGAELTLSADLYLGPKVQDEMEALATNLRLTVDYGYLWFIAQPLFMLLGWLQGFVGNWGVSIILVTLLIKLAFYKLSATSYRSMANMRRVAPKMQRIKEECGDDRQKLSQAMMELYRKEKINPMGGCLPILLQMPVFIALYWMLMESVELRHAPFMLWITDLSVKDPYFVLPILMGITMYLQQLLNPTPPDPMQARIMKMLPIIFTFFFLFFPSGLVLYWLVNNILSIAQQWYITRKIEKEFEAREAREKAAITKS